MLDDVLRSPAVTQYLQCFPHAQWEQCLELTLALGIQTAMQLFPYGCTIENLARAVLPPSRSALDTRPADKHRTEVCQTARADTERQLNQPKRRGSSETTFLRVQDGKTWERKTETRKERKHSGVPKNLKDVPSRIKAEVRRDIERFFTPQKPQDPVKGDDGSDSRSRVDRPSLIPPRSHPPRPIESRQSTRDKSQRTTPAGSANSSLLIEPKTNTAFIDKLTGDEPWTESTENSVMKITDKFLSDPIMTTLSNRTSPRLTQTSAGFRQYY